MSCPPAFFNCVVSTPAVDVVAVAGTAAAAVNRVFKFWFLFLLLAVFDKLPEVELLMMSLLLLL